MDRRAAWSISNMYVLACASGAGRGRRAQRIRALRGEVRRHQPAAGTRNLAAHIAGCSRRWRATRAGAQKHWVEHDRCAALGGDGRTSSDARTIRVLGLDEVGAQAPRPEGDLPRRIEDLARGRKVLGRISRASRRAARATFRPIFPVLRDPERVQCALRAGRGSRHSPQAAASRERRAWRRSAEHRRIGQSSRSAMRRSPARRHYREMPQGLREQARNRRVGIRYSSRKPRSSPKPATSRPFAPSGEGESMWAKHTRSRACRR